MAIRPGRLQRKLLVRRSSFDRAHHPVDDVSTEALLTGRVS